MAEFNAVRILLKVIFMSDQIYLHSNKVKECYLRGEINVAMNSIYNWPEFYPLKQAFALWRRFISVVSFLGRILITTIITSQGSIHRNKGSRDLPRIHQDFLNNKWFNESVHMIKLNVILPVLFSNQAKVVINRSFYLAKSYLISIA